MTAAGIDLVTITGTAPDHLPTSVVTVLGVIAVFVALSLGLSALDAKKDGESPRWYALSFAAVVLIN